MAISIVGPYNNPGTLSLDPNDEIDIGNASVPSATLTGGGMIALSAFDAINSGVGGAVLTNVDNTIEAQSGTVSNGNGANTLNVITINDQKGTIVAAGASNNSGLLVMNASVTNKGTLAATGGGNLVLQNDIQVDSAGGGIIEAGVGDSGSFNSRVILNGATLAGGTLETANGGIIEVKNGVFDDGTVGHSVSNKANVVVDGGGALTLVGTIFNAGSIALSSGATLDIGIGSGILSGVTLGGGKTIVLASSDAISAGVSGAVLTNQNNTITAQGGAVSNGNGADSLNVATINVGVIAAAGANNNSGVLNVNANLTNEGTLKATGGGNLILQNDIQVDGSRGGIVEAGVGDSAPSTSRVSLNGMTLLGGTLETAHGGTVEVTSGNAVFDGSSHPVTNAGSVVVDSGGTLTLVGTIDNTGTISLNPSAAINIGDAADPGAMLTGGGTVALSSSDGINAGVGGAVLTNVNNTIEATGGTVSNGNGANALRVTTINELNGVIEAADANNGNGVLDVNANVTNDGLLAATGGGNLILQNGIQVDNSGGGIIAAGVTDMTSSNSIVSLNGVTLLGGTLETGHGGTIEVTSGNAVFDGGNSHAVTNMGSVLVDTGGTLYLAGSIDNIATLSLNGSSAIAIGTASDSGATLTGSGTVVLSSSAAINQGVGGAVLDNVDNTIEATGGTVSNGNGANTLGVAVVNEQDGVIEAAGNYAGAGVLVVNAGPVDAGQLTNDGLLAATGGGNLILQNRTRVDGSGGGVITAGVTDTSMAGSRVTLGDGATLLGGTLKTGNGGFIEITGGTFDGTGGHVVTNTGSVVVDSGSTLTLTGIIDNTGTISANTSAQIAIGNATSAAATLTDGGTVILSSSAAINGGVGAAVLTNVDNTIEATGGTVSNGNGSNTLGVAVVNEQDGVIEAAGNYAGAGVLVVNAGPVDAGQLTNDGLLAATGGGNLILQNRTRVDGSGGGVIAAGVTDSGSFGSRVTLGDGATLLGGTLKTGNGGFIEITGGTFDGTGGHVVTNTGSVVVDTGSTLTLTGTTDNTGTISANASAQIAIGNATSAAATLTDGGTVVLSSFDAINAGVGGAVLDNVGNVIEATGGTVSNGNGGNALRVTTINELNGVILAAGANNNAGLLTVTGGITNYGTLTATGGGELHLQSGITNDGLLAANGGTVLVDEFVSGTGTVGVAGGGSTILGAGTSENAAFAGPGVLQIANANSLSGTLAGVAGTIEATNVSGGQTLTYTANSTNTGGTLSVHEFVSEPIFDSHGTQIGSELVDVVIWSLNVAGNHTVADFSLGSAGGGQSVSGTSATTTSSWIGGNGTWQTASKWSSGIPGAWTNAVLAAHGGYTVTDSTSTTVYSIATGSGVALNITGGTFWTNEGTSTAMNAGLLRVFGGATFDIAGYFENASTGQISAYAAGATVGLYAANIAGGTLSIAAGAIVQAANAQSEVNGVAVSDKGTLLATGGGVLTLVNTTIAATGGLIEASGGTIALDNATVTGGTLTTASGAIDTAAGSQSTLNGVAVSMGSTVAVVADSSLVLKGTIANAGTFLVAGSGATDSGMLLVGANTTLTGGGGITLSSGTGGGGVIGSAHGLSTAVTLSNTNNTIQGVGQIGDAGMRLTNKGVIEAVGGTLTLNTGASTVTNTGGTLEASAGATLAVDNVLTNTGTIQTAGGTIDLAGKTTNSGTLESDTTDELDLAAVTSSSIINAYGDIVESGILTNSGTVFVSSTGSYDVNSTLSNSGTMQTSGGLLVVTGTAVNAGSSLIEAMLGGDVDIDGTMTNRGTMKADGNGALDLAANVNNTGGTLIAAGGSIFAQSLTGAGTATIEDSGSIEFGGAANAHVGFVGAGTLEFDHSPLFKGDIAGAVTGDTLVFKDMASTDSVQLGYVANLGDTGGVLNVHDLTDNITAKLAIVGSGYATASFTPGSDHGSLALQLNHAAGV